MNKHIQSSLAGLAILVFAATAAQAGFAKPKPPPTVKGYQYAVKYVCYNENQAPTASVATAINIVNANAADTVVIGRTVPAPTYPSEGTSITPQSGLLGAFEATNYDCAVIRSSLGDNSYSTIEGFTILQSCQPLDVTAIYGLLGSGDVETIAGRQITLLASDCVLP